MVPTGAGKATPQGHSGGRQSGVAIKRHGMIILFARAYKTACGGICGAQSWLELQRPAIHLDSQIEAAKQAMRDRRTRKLIANAKERADWALDDAEKIVAARATVEEADQRASPSCWRILRSALISANPKPFPSKTFFDTAPNKKTRF